jgi:hypothetical protein
MSIFVIRFEMMNGSVIELEREAEEQGKIILSVINNETNWYCLGHRMINLNNVFSVDIKEKNDAKVKNLEVVDEKDEEELSV